MAKKPEVAKKAAAKKAAAKKPAVKAPATVVTRPVAAAKPSALAVELCKAAGVTMNKGESKTDFAERLCTKISELTDDQYATLSDGARKWFEGAAQQINAGKKVDFEEGTAGPAPAVKARPAKEAKGKAPVNGKTPRTEGVAFKLRELVVGAPDIAFGDAAKKVGVEAVHGGHAWNCWYNTRLVMREVARQAQG